MANPDSTEIETKSNEQTKLDMGIVDPYNVFTTLWERSSDTLTEAELEWFAGSLDCANTVSKYLEHTVEGIGCLVCDDKDAGSFQGGYDLTKLLFGVANSIGSIRALVHIGDSAQRRLINPAHYKMLADARSRV